MVTINALLATAAWIDGLSVITLDQTGLAQKGGAVVSSMMLSERPIEAVDQDRLRQCRPAAGLRSARRDQHRKPEARASVAHGCGGQHGGCPHGRRHARQARQISGPGRAVDIINTYTDSSRNVFVDASRLAEGLFASHLAANVFLLGVAYQGGHIPLTAAAIEEAIRLNGTDATRNLAVFHWGRKYYHDAQVGGGRAGSAEAERGAATHGRASRA